MKNRRLTLILCGQQICHDKILNSLLLEKYDIVCLENSSGLEDAAVRKKAKLVIVEFLSNGLLQLDIVKKLTAKLDKAAIVVVTDNLNVEDNAEILITGALDVFPKPYQAKMLAERVDTLIKVFT